MSSASTDLFAVARMTVVAKVHIAITKICRRFTTIVTLPNQMTLMLQWIPTGHLQLWCTCNT